jgi:hypothetical protein
MIWISIYHYDLLEIKFVGSNFWCRNILIVFFALFSLIFGIEKAIGSFYLSNPLEFIMLFFSSSFIMLLGIVGILYPVFQISTLFKFRNINDSK